MKNERGSVTLFVLISMLFFLIIVVTAYVSASNKLQGQNEEIAQIKASYEQDLSDEALLQLYNKVTRTREWLSGSGTLEDTYKIYKIEDLVTFSIRSNNGEFKEEGTGEARYIYVELMNDLDFKRDSSYAKADRTDFGDVNEDGTVQDLKTELTTGQGFPCIAATEANAFTGNFEGNEHEIKHLWISNTTTYANKGIGIFGNVGNSTIRDLEVSGKILTSALANAGGIVGRINSSITCNILNCKNESDITSTISGYSVGGMVGATEGILNVTDCHNDGNLSGANNAGGIVGYINNSVKIQGCYNTGEITNTIGSYVGGLIGRDNSSSNSITIDNSYNEGKIIGKDLTGGICGTCWGTFNIKNSYNDGEIYSTYNSTDYGTGGILGRSADSDILIVNCYNKKNITGITNIGGIVGRSVGNTRIIENCYNLGIVTGTSNIGMILGYGTGNIANNCYYLSTLSTTDSYATPKTETEMKLQLFVDLLNSGQTDAPWTMDTNNINNGYPVLKWQIL